MKKPRHAASYQYGFVLGFVILTMIASSAGSNSSESDQQTGLAQLSLEQLGNIEVTTASKAPEQAWKSSAAVYVITQDDIERSGATTVPEALRLAPGVEVARIDSNKWSIGIRGFGSRLARDVLVLIDGRTVYTTLLAGTYWEVQNLMLQDVERIEIIRGPGATIWGPNAVNGVINIITRKTAETHGALVNVGGGNEEQGFFNARYGGGNAKTFDYRIYALGFKRGPEFHPDGVDYDRWRAAQGGFRIDFATTDRDKFTVQGDIYEEGAGETVSATTFAPPFSQVLQGTEHLSGGNILGRWQRSQGDGKDFQLQFYYDRANRKEPNFIDIRDTFDVDFLDRFRLPAGQQVSWGFGARASRGSNPTVVSGLVFRPSDRTDQLWTLFLQDDVDLIEGKLSVSLGTKLLKTNYTGLQLQPSARLLWTPSRSQSFWAAFTHAVRTPSAAERAFFLAGFGGIAPNGLPVFARFNANPNFKSEELNGYEAGFRDLVGETLSFDISVFFNHYSGLFSQDITGPLFVETGPPPTHLLLPAEFGNGLRGTTKGVEIAPEWKPVSFWRLRTTYSYLQMNLEKGRNSLDVGTAAFIEGSSPKHQVTVLSGLDISKKFGFDLTYRYVSSLPKLSPTLSVKAYSTADARFDWRISRQFMFSIVGRNLFQPYHYEFASDPGPMVGIKRTGYGQITWTR
jgi:iron complex outermembrane recepter protein